MSLQELKGFEFDDVILFNFFSDSPVHWGSVKQFTDDWKRKHKASGPNPERNSELEKLETSFENLDSLKDSESKSTIDEKDRSLGRFDSHLPNEIVHFALGN